MKKEDLQVINSLCKRAHIKGAATQFMLNGATKEQAAALAVKTAKCVSNMEKIATARKEAIKSIIRATI